MRNKMTVVALAVVVAAAFAALSGVLLPSGTAVYAQVPENTQPTFITGISTTLSVPENTPAGTNIGSPIAAEDDDEATLEYGDTLTYSLEATASTNDARADAAHFDIDKYTGQLITKGALDLESEASYSVRVRVTDSREATATTDVQISVTGENEPPHAPTMPTVVSGRDETGTNDDESTTTIKVIWHAPENVGRPDINSYDLQYKRSAEQDFLPASPINTTDTNYTIEGLAPGTSYQVRVRAKNADGDSPWSLVGAGSTNKGGNRPPVSNEQNPPSDLRVPENAEPGHNVEGPVAATDGDSARLTYSLEGPDADSFDFDTSSGQIRTKRGVTYDHETKTMYFVTVVVVDDAGGSEATPVEIEVDDISERAAAPARPTVRPTDESSSSIDVSWAAPENTGPAIPGYEVRYRTGNENFSPDNCGQTGVGNCNLVTGTTATIVGLQPNTTYEVQVRAGNGGEGFGDWSVSGTGRTSKANQEPIFDDRPDGSDRNSELSVTRTVKENTRAGQLVGTVRADDGDGDRLTYIFDGSGDAEEFDIEESSGRILTKAPLDTEAECSDDDASLRGAHAENCNFTVKVQVRDGLNEDRVKEEDPQADDTVTVTINVRDEVETPATPTVSVTSPTVDTAQNVDPTLEMNWDVPENTGPEITSYEVQYRKGSGSFSSENCGSTGGTCNGLTVTNTTIVDLESDTSYSVQVRARNAEGASPWSRVVTVKTNEDMNQAPEFPSVPQVTLDVPEDTSAGQPIPIPQSEQGNLTATEDQPDSATLTYSLEGRDASSFNIDSRSGQIRTRAKLNLEEKDSYSVRVKVVDGDGGSDSQNVIINVTNVDEPPSAPSAPRVTATADSGRSLDVSWNEPRSSGGPTITDYDIQYRKAGGTEDDWQLWPHGTEEAGDTTRTATITTIGDPSMPLESRTQYEVRVRAKNGEGDTTANWSAVGRGTTGGGNSRPSFDDTADVVVLSVAENTRAGQNVGSPVSASDADSNRLTYRLEGPGADSFTIVSGSGQMRTKSPLDHESRESYSVTVRVDDGSGRDNSGRAKSVTISVDDVEEAPSSPAAPRVVGIPGTTDRVLVIWEEPANKGNPVTDYDVHYGESGSGGFARWDHFGADGSTIITGLSSGTRYQVQVRAKNDEGTSEWSRSGSGAPNPDVANRNPAFSGGSRTLSVRENTGPSADVGTPARATDPDGDTLTYTLEGPDSDSFYIISTGGGGQILTSAPLDHEQKPSYSVTVRVADGRGGSDTVNLTITVTDEGGEAPSAPVAPTVTAGSSTSLQVRWDVPENSGPDIADYDYRYRESSESGWTEVTNTAISDTNVTISSLTPNTPYFVQVRAKSDEGTSSWSNSGIGLTDPPGANSAPEFSGTSTSRSVVRSAPAGSSIGVPITATDADTDDTLTYSLGGTDATSFDINSSTGQLLTRAGVALDVASYTVTVVATDDGAASAEITVTITLTNRAPEFSSASTTRSVARSATAGRAIGDPVAATDADTGDTLTYTIEGTDAAAFRIISSTGQLLTQAALDEASYTVTVVATDEANETARITVTINVSNRAPQFSETSTTRIVDRSAPVGTAIGDPVTATDADAGDLLAYRLAGTDAASFRINSSTGQLLTRAGVALDVASYSVTVVATDQADETSSINVTISVANSAPVFSGTTTSRSVDRSAPVGTAIGDPVTATDTDTGDSLAYNLAGTDAASFRINSSTGQLLTRAGVVLDAASYAVTVVATDELTASASITVTITVANAAPAFSDMSTSRSVPRSAPAEADIGNPVTATDADPGDTLTYSLVGTDAASFGIDRSTGQLLTRQGVALDRASYTMTVVATDDLGATASVTVTITVDNTPPAFSDESTSRSVARGAAADTRIGAPVTAMDADTDDTLTYSLGGDDAASFGIDSSNGQLLTLEEVALDEDSYTVTVVATDDLGATASVAVTIITVDDNAPPAFSDESTSRSVARGAPADTRIGAPVTAMDADTGDALAYSLGGDDAASFGIDSSNGQLLTLEEVALDEDSYTVTVIATDELGAAASIAVTITVTDGDSLLARFDTDEDGTISQDEVFKAILEFLSSQANRDEILGIILLYITQ